MENENVEKKRNKFVDFLKSFTPYQIIYLSMVIVMVALFAIFLPDEMLEDTSNTFVLVCSIIAVVANPICELLISKQSKWNFIVSIVFIEVTGQSSKIVTQIVRNLCHIVAYDHALHTC